MCINTRQERLRAELEDAQRKFDKLASVYETQWKDLDAVTFKMQQMQEDISTYQQVLALCDRLWHCTVENIHNCPVIRYAPPNSQLPRTLRPIFFDLPRKFPPCILIGQGGGPDRFGVAAYPGM